MKEKIRIVVLLLCLLVMYLVLNFIDPLLLWDENVYLANARSHISISNFKEDFRFPLLEYIIALIWFITGESIFVAKLAMILFSLGSIYVFYLIAKEYFSDMNAFLATILFSLSPLMIYWGFRVYTDNVALFFMSVSYYLIIKGFDNIEFLVGIIFALSFLTKFSFGLFGIAVVIHFLFKKRLKKILMFSAGFILALVPWMIYNYIHYSNIIWDIILQWSVVQIYTHVEPISKHFINASYIGGILLLFIPFGIINLIKEKKNYVIMFIYSGLNIFYYFSIVPLKEIRYYFSIISFLYIIMFSGILFASNKIRSLTIKRIMYIIIIFSIMSLFVFQSMQIIRRGYCEKQGATLQAINHVGSQKDEYTAVISNIWPYFGYYNNVYAYSLWTKELNTQLKRYNIDYVIYHNKEGLNFNKTLLDINQDLYLRKEINGICNDNIYIFQVIK